MEAHAQTCSRTRTDMLSHMQTHSGTRAHRHSCMQTTLHARTQTLLHADTLACAHTDTLACRHPCTRAHRPLLRAHGHALTHTQTSTSLMSCWCKELTLEGLKLTFLALPCSSPDTAGWLLNPCLTFSAVNSSWTTTRGNLSEAEHRTAKASGEGKNKQLKHKPHFLIRLQKSIIYYSIIF